MRSPAQRLYVVTNYHVATGRDPRSNEPLSKTGYVPDRLLFTFYRGTRGEQHYWSQGVLLTENPDGMPLWFEHPQYGRRFDVVAIPLPSAIRPETILALPLFPYHPLAVFPGSNVSIIGYPEGITGSGIFPIWKTGGVASEPEELVGQEDFFWIDANTRKGMSGSPVIARSYGSYLGENQTFATTGTPVNRLLGVYAGRALDAIDMTLGRVWRLRGLIDIILAADAHFSRGNILPKFSTVGHFRRPEMGQFNNRTLPTTPAHVQLAELARLVAEVDQRFGASLDNCKLAAELISSCEKSKTASAATVDLSPAAAALLAAAIREPQGWAIPGPFRKFAVELEQLCAELDQVVTAPTPSTQN